MLMLALTLVLAATHARAVSVASCLALAQTFRFENTTIIGVTHVGPNANFSVPGTCQSSAQNGPAPVCRVQIVTNTTSTSSVHMEAWLPDTWFGRFIGLGNGGLGGCIDYQNLPYTTSLNFATISSDNGHDGNSGIVFLNHPEVINDFAFRAVHTEALVGKALVQHYYGKKQDKSYYLGCSTGGRQGVQAATLFPEDFDGIVAGSPAVDFNHLTDWSMYLGLFIGAANSPNASTSPMFIPASLFPIISQEILRQCDALDGLVDGIIAEPDDCIFRPEALICPAKTTNTSTCLTATQVNSLRQVFSPIFDGDQHLLYPRLDPGAEANGTFALTLSGQLFPFSVDWYQFVVLNTTFDFANFNLSTVAIGDAVNPGGISTFNGELGAFEARGGKLLTYHGRRDQLIASGNSKRLYNLVSQTLAMPNLDSFYRLFLIPGMEHCEGGQGAWAFGQGGLVSSVHNDTTHNILLALVDWVEKGVAPPSITGSIPGNATGDREHCRYPQRTFWTGTAWTCVA